VALFAALSLLLPPASFAQPAPVSGTSEATVFNAEQLDALLAPVALYPDALLAQVLMATTYPLQVVDASRWLEVPANKSLTGDALTRALTQQNWDPSVKSLIPFSQVLAMLNSKLDWMQQVGYAFATQNADVMNSVQRLRQQAQAAGYLKTNEQQRVVTEKNIVVIEPANTATVYVPVYSPTVVYGTWPYPAYPPVYLQPPPGYVVGTAFVSGLAFATGVAVVGSLWGWARPSWYGGNVNVNVNRYNNINVNRPPINSPAWRPPAGVGGRPVRPPVGPVGPPARPIPLPANAIGRPNVQVPASAVNRPGGSGGTRPSGGIGGGIGGGSVNRPPAAAQLPASSGPNRTNASGSTGQAGGVPRPGGGSPGGLGGQRTGSGVSGNAQNRPLGGAQRPAGVFGGVNDGARARQFDARGAQSRAAPPRSGNIAAGVRGRGR
jgi:hypothetical protein